MAVIASFYLGDVAARVEHRVVQGAEQFICYSTNFVGITETYQPFFNREPAMDLFRETVQATLDQLKGTTQ